MQSTTETDEASVDILLVEDNPGDVRLIEEAFRQAELDHTYRAFTTGSEALEYLFESDDRPLPDLVFLDLDLPGDDGCEVLRKIRDDSQLQCLPVIMLTGSRDADDIMRCYSATANAYLTKPTDPKEFVSLVKAVKHFWFDHTQLPSISQSQ